MHFKSVLPAMLAGSAVLALAGCGSDTTATSSQNTIQQAYAQAKSTTNAMEAVKPAASVRGLTGVSPNFFGASEDWTTTPAFIDPRNGGSLTQYLDKITFKQWLQLQFDSTAVNANGASINVFGRINSGMGMFCALGEGLPSTAFNTDGTPVLGAHTITFTQAVVDALNSKCGMGDMSSALNQTMPVTIDATTDTTNYDYHVTLTGASIGESHDLHTYLRNNNTAINIAMFERNDPGVYRTMVAYDKVNKIGRASYVSAVSSAGSTASAGLYGYRIHVDETAGIGHLLIREGGADADNSGFRYTLAGKPGDSTASFSISMMETYGDLVAGKHEACVKNDGTALTDGGQCTGTDPTVIAIDDLTLTGVFTDLFSNVQTDAWYSADGLSTSTTHSVAGAEAKVIEFTNDSDMYVNNFAP